MDQATQQDTPDREALIMELQRTLYARDIAGALIDARAQRDELAAALRGVVDNEDVFHLVVNGHLIDAKQREEMLQSLFTKGLPALYEAARDALAKVPA